MDEFLRESKTVSISLDRLEKYENKLEILFNDKTNNPLNFKEEKKINFKIDAANKIFKEQSTKIKNFLLKIKNNENNEISQKTKEIQIENIGFRFSEILKKYQKILLEQGDLEKERAKNEYLIMNPKATEKDIDEYLNSKGKTQKSVFAAGKERSTALNKKIEDRHKRIKEISKNAVVIAELIQISKDLVFEQRESINKIEINIETARRDTQQGTENLEQAREYQQAANQIRSLVIKAVCIIGGLLLLGIIVSALIQKA